MTHDADPSPTGSLSIEANEPISRVQYVLRPFRVAFDRIIFGPAPPVGKAFKPEKRWRCYLGLHYYRQVWEAVRLSQDEENGRHRMRVGLNLDREPDYTECEWCKKIQHQEPEPVL